MVALITHSTFTSSINKCAFAWMHRKGARTLDSNSPLHFIERDLNATKVSTCCSRWVGSGVGQVRYVLDQVYNNVRHHRLYDI